MLLWIHVAPLSWIVLAIFVPPSQKGCGESWWATAKGIKDNQGCERVSSLEKKWLKRMWGCSSKSLVPWREWIGDSTDKINVTQIKQLGGSCRATGGVCPAIHKLWCSWPLHVCRWEFTWVHEWLGGLWERNLPCSLAVRTVQYQILGTDCPQRITADADWGFLLKTANRNLLHREA